MTAEVFKSCARIIRDETPDETLRTELMGILVKLALKSITVEQIPDKQDLIRAVQENG